MKKPTSKSKSKTAVAKKEGKVIDSGSIKIKNGREVHKDEKFHVVEFEPQCRTLKMSMFQKRTKRYLAFPYTQFTRYFGRSGTSLHLSFTNKPIKKIDQTVYFPPLQNIWYPNLQCCLMHCASSEFQTMMDYFWNTEYLDCEDWYSVPVLDKETPMRTYMRWEEMTKEDPDFILGVKWKQKAKISEIPEFDMGGSKYSKIFGDYPGTPTNRQGLIRTFAIVPAGR